MSTLEMLIPSTATRSGSRTPGRQRVEFRGGLGAQAAARPLLETKSPLFGLCHARAVAAAAKTSRRSWPGRIPRAHTTPMGPRVLETTFGVARAVVGAAGARCRRRPRPRLAASVLKVVLQALLVAEQRYSSTSMTSKTMSRGYPCFLRSTQRCRVDIDCRRRPRPSTDAFKDRCVTLAETDRRSP